MMVFGRDLCMPCDVNFLRPPKHPVDPAAYMSYLTARLEQVHYFTRERLSQAFTRMKAHYDQHSTADWVVPGDKVWLDNPTRKKRRFQTLHRNWDGSLTVVCRLNNIVHGISYLALYSCSVTRRSSEPFCCLPRYICIVKAFYYILLHF